MRETKRASRQAVRLKRNRYDALAKSKGWVSGTDHARGTGLSQPTVSRILNDDKDWYPSPLAIAALLTAFDVDFSELFEVVEEKAA
jgi:transcriptional regulator with XRE-family HTH domain